jgi:hypothetical protein
MNDEKPFYKNLRILSVIFIILISFASIIPSSLKSEKQINKPCLEHEDDSLDESLAQQESPEENIRDQLDCFLDPNKELFVSSPN